MLSKSNINQQFILECSIPIPEGRLLIGDVRIKPFYDSLIAKIIVQGEDRAEAIAKMKRALDECVIEGVTTNIDYLYSILEDKDFISGNFDTSFIEQKETKR